MIIRLYILQVITGYYSELRPVLKALALPRGGQSAHCHSLNFDEQFPATIIPSYRFVFSAVSNKGHFTGFLNIDNYFCQTGRVI
jgi:hypothetical protein